jgi:hypothetical protein
VAKQGCVATEGGEASLDLEKILKNYEKKKQLVSNFYRNSAATTSAQA